MGRERLALACVVVALAAVAGDAAGAEPPAKPEPLVLHVMRAADSPLEPWLHDTTRWFIRQKKEPLEVVFVEKFWSKAPSGAQPQTSAPVTNAPESGPSPGVPDLIVLESKAEPLFYGMAVPQDARALGSVELVLAARAPRKPPASLRRALQEAARTGARLAQPEPESVAGLYALYLESLPGGAPRDRRALAKQADFVTLESLLREKDSARNRCFIIPDTWCGAMQERGEKLTVAYPQEGVVRFTLVAFVPAGVEGERKKLAQELLDFLALRAQSDPPPKCTPKQRSKPAARAPSADMLKKLAAGLAARP